MAFDLTNFDDDLAAVTADMPTTMTFDGTDYSVISTDIRKGKELDLEGFDLDHDLELHCRTTLFSTRPVAGDKVTVGGVVYRVESVTTDPDDNLIKLNCKEED